MSVKDEEPKKMFYSIGEVAKIFNVNTSLIRFWEGEFDLLRPHKNKKGNRLFTQKDVDHLHIIYHLVKERGFTLQGAKDKMRGNPQDTVNNAEVVNSLKKVKEFLLELKEQL